MESLKQGKIVCVPYGGADIFDCVKEAIILALQDTVPVEFKHNGRLYVVDPVKIHETVRETGTQT